MRELFVTNQFEKDLRKLPKDTQTEADSKVQLLQTDPLGETLDIKKLKGFHNPALYRMRIGVYRILYSFTPRELVLHRTKHRKDMYR